MIKYKVRKGGPGGSSTIDPTSSHNNRPVNIQDIVCVAYYYLALLKKKISYLTACHCQVTSSHGSPWCLPRNSNPSATDSARHRPHPHSHTCRKRRHGGSIHHPAILKNRIGLAQLMDVNSGGRLDKRGEAREHIVEFIQCVARELGLEWWALARVTAVMCGCGPLRHTVKWRARV
jgi:hypothetical protein